MKRRIAVAMSGGVDSSAAALLLRKEGFELVGFTMKVWDSSRCCSLDDVADARRVAAKLDIPFYVLDAKERFDADVITPFIEEYGRGRTPNPCILCNRRTKFKWLMAEASALGCEALATGHYARLVDGDDGKRLLRGVDRSKDQSYFLVPETPDGLDGMLFPLGGLEKAEARRLAAEAALPVASKKDSQDACFIPQEGLAHFLSEHIGPQPGEIVDEKGRVLGKHEGIHAYTIGQRKGLGIASGAPLYVAGKDTAENRIIVGPRSSTLSEGLRASKAVWLRGAPAEETFDCQVKIRSTAREAGCSVKRSGDEVEVAFDDPQFGVAPGQMAVFYKDDLVLGGAWIERGL